MSYRKVKNITYELWEFVFSERIITPEKLFSFTYTDWLSPGELAGWKRKKCWKLLVAKKKLSSVSITLKF